MTRYLPSPLVCFAFLAAFLLYMSRFAPMVTDGDTLWHFWAGKDIWRLGTLPESDAWSFTASSHRWFNLSWAWDALSAVVLEHFRLPVVMVLCLTLASLAIAVTASTLWKSTGHVIAVVVATWFAALLLTQGVSIRPQLISYLCTAVLIAIAERQSCKPQWCNTAAIACLMVLWANMHGGVAIGLAILAFYALEAWSSPSRAAFRQMVVTLAIAALACLVTPYHIHMPQAIARTLGGELIGYVSEWRHLDPRVEVLPAIHILLLAGIAFWQRASLRLVDGCLIVLGIAMAIVSVRHIPLLGVITALPLARALVPACNANAVLASANARYVADMHQTKRSGMILAVITMLWSALLVPQVHDKWLQIPSEFKGPDMPWGAIAFVQSVFPDARLLNHYNYGGAIAYFSQGRLKYFIDGRAETAFPPEVVHDYIIFATQQGNWQSVLSRYKIDAVMLPLGDPLAEWFAQRDWIWKKAYSDHQAIVYGHKDYVPGTPYDMPVKP